MGYRVLCMEFRLSVLLYAANFIYAADWSSGVKFFFLTSFMFKATSQLHKREGNTLCWWIDAFVFVAVLLSRMKQETKTGPMVHE